MYNIIKKTTIVSILLLTNLSAKEFLLNDLINMALKNNENLKSSRSKELSKKEKINLAKVGYLPTLSLTGELAKYNIESNQIDTNDNVNSVTINGSLLLYDFGKTNAMVNISKSNYKVSTYQTSILKNKIKLLVNQAYYNILKQYHLIDVVNESIELDTLQLKQAKAFLKAGIRTKLDVTNAQLNLSNTKLELIKAKYKLKSLKTKLTTVLGTKMYDNIEISYDDTDILDLAKNIKSNTLELDQLISKGLDTRAEIFMYQDILKAQKSNIKSIKKEYAPKLNFDASYVDQNSNTLSLSSNKWTAGVYLKWNIFTGDSTNISIKDNLAQLSDIKSRSKQQNLNITEEITDAYFFLKAYGESINISILSVNLSMQNLSLAKKRYKSGLNDLLEYNNAKLDYTTAKSKLVNLYYDYLVAQKKLKYTIGSI